MKSSIVCGLITACALALPVAAQEKQKDKAAQKEHTMTGCLQKGTEANTFVVASTAEKGPKTIGILESKPNLAPHVGHKIDITGTAVPAKEAESAKPKPSKADHYMNLSAIKMISATCP
ncbi:MAG: hypothetical protein HYS05_20775 [Acidobacteria bacterium]|nr:hypothetical protein [Acidobacteriota bacterium]